MKTIKCPRPKCNVVKKLNEFSRDGKFFRQDDSRYIQRYKCRSCGKKFSNATFDPAYRQKKRRVNTKLQQLLSSTYSMRRAAKFLRIDKKTVARRLGYLASRARVSQEKFLKSLKSQKVREMQFDDLITLEHSKLKPLSVTLAVEKHTRKILGCQVSSMPAFGHLAKLSRKKYGHRRDDRIRGINCMLEKIKTVVTSRVTIETDEHNFYPPAISKHLPSSIHVAYLGGRGAVTGQGELKKQKHDPLFSLNHTCAMLRANINRLIRKTWCTTKLQGKLKEHLDIYINFHNTVLTK